MVQLHLGHLFSKNDAKRWVLFYTYVRDWCVQTPEHTDGASSVHKKELHLHTRTEPRWNDSNDDRELAVGKWLILSVFHLLTNLEYVVGKITIMKTGPILQGSEDVNLTDAQHALVALQTMLEQLNECPENIRCPGHLFPHSNISGNVALSDSWKARCQPVNAN